MNELAIAVAASHAVNNMSGAAKDSSYLSTICNVAVIIAFVFAVVPWFKKKPRR